MKTHDPSDVGRMEKKDQSRRDIRLNDIKFVMGDIRGRRFVMNLLTRCSVRNSEYDPSGSKMYFNAGLRYTGLTIEREVEEADPELYDTMRKEARNDDTE
jgi:hypothetical protein